jgi:hypothetical protein
MRGCARCAGLLLAGLAVAVPAGSARAWPASLIPALTRDALKVVPRSLGRLLLERQDKILDEAQRFPPELDQALSADLASGTLSAESQAALDAYVGQALELIKKRRVSEGLVRLGATLRIAATFSDPILTGGGPDGYPPGVTREYYAFVEANLSKIPVVLEDPKALDLPRKQLGSYWQSLMDSSRSQAPVIRGELFPGRLVDHRSLDWRSPIFSAASLSYSRTVTAIAATWMAQWREVRGDVTRQPQPKLITPHDAATEPVPARTPQPED